MKYLIFLFYALTCGLFATARLADPASGNRLRTRVTGKVIHCGHCSDKVGMCKYYQDKLGDWRCMAVPPPSRSAYKYTYLARVAEQVGVNLSPDTYYYFKMYTTSRDPRPDNLESWMRKNTGGYDQVNLVIAKTSSDGTELDATMIHSSYRGRWYISTGGWDIPARGMDQT
ncbi:hypothetical protein LZ30DRAFT_15971 [Colletotrichum cereale]|nr:hypothetical protein LZ30DRAFT_15971 [Colletotrichum cereale]